MSDSPSTTQPWIEALSAVGVIASIRENFPYKGQTRVTMRAPLDMAGSPTYIDVQADGLTACAHGANGVGAGRVVSLAAMRTLS